MSNLDANTLTVIGIIVAWIIFRISIFTERAGILNTLSAELSWHKHWMAGIYYENQPDNPNWSNKSYLVYKLSTASIDNAINRGSVVFFDNELLKNVTYYRQTLERFNQLVELATAYQSNAELWDSSKIIDKSVTDRMTILTKQIHLYGIGNNDEPFRFGHYFYEQVQNGIDKERHMYVISLVWFLLNMNIYPVKRFLCRYF